MIRIGTSPMTPAQILVELWPKIHALCLEIRFQLVPFENTPENAREILANLGRNIDVIAGIFDETMLNVRNCAGFEISRQPICCAARRPPERRACSFRSVRRRYLRILFDESKKGTIGMKPGMIARSIVDLGMSVAGLRLVSPYH